jgi:hypothetical protein
MRGLSRIREMHQVRRIGPPDQKSADSICGHLGICPREFANGHAENLPKVHGNRNLPKLQGNREGIIIV